jgi:hypothetical protein
VNLQAFIIALVLLIFSFVLIFPGFSALNKKKERICQVLARITEKEANFEFKIIEKVELLLYSENEDFLKANFMNYS